MIAISVEEREEQPEWRGLGKGRRGQEWGQGVSTMLSWNFALEHRNEANRAPGVQMGEIACL